MRKVFKMKKPLKVLASLSVAATLFVSLSQGTAYASEPIGTVEVQANNLYLRSNDNFNSNIVRVLHKGETYKVYSKHNGMYNLGENQWTSANGQYVSYSSSGENATSSQAVSENTSGKVTVKVGSLYTRADASFSASTVRVAHQGDTFTVYEKKNGLYRIGANEWISASSTYVSLEGTAPTTTTTSVASTTSQQATGKVKVLVASLNIRVAPSFNAKVVGTVEKGDIITVFEKKNGLYRIGDNKWISAGTSFVTTNLSTSTTPTTSAVTTTPTTSSSTSNASAQQIINYGKKFMGLPYVWGSSSPSYGGFDCSGFIYYVYKNNGYNIYRSNVEGYWNMVQRLQSPSVGDLVFFKNTYRVGPSHIGIYLGNGKFLNASSSHGISIADMNSSYWKQHFLGYGKFVR